jgi:hypothetical protein
VVVAGARSYHQFEVNLRRRVLGLAPQDVRPLDTKQAMEVATSVMSEVVLFSLAGAAVYWEWSRSVAQRPRPVARRGQQQRDRLSTVSVWY